MNAKNYNTLKAAAALAGRSLDEVLAEYEKASHDHKREIMHTLKKLVKGIKPPNDGRFYPL